MATDERRFPVSADVAAVPPRRDRGLELDLVHDDPASGTFGAFDPERMQEITDTFVPILFEQGAIDAEQIDPTELYTNEFLDSEISMSASGG